MHVRRSSASVLVLGVLAAGCAAPLPRHGALPPTEAMHILRERAARVATVSSRCRIVLTQRDGPSVELDGVLVARAPDHLRLRAWKLSQPVLDLTLRPDGLWLFTAEDRDRAGNPRTGELEGERAGAFAAALRDLTAPRVRYVWSILTGAFGEGTWTASVWDDRRLRVVNDDPESGYAIACEVDRSTLTLHECSLGGGEDAPSMIVRWETYRRFGDIVWPLRMRMEGPAGAITVTMDDPVFNEELAHRAFDPPPRAVRRP